MMSSPIPCSSDNTSRTSSVPARPEHVPIGAVRIHRARYKESKTSTLDNNCLEKWTELAQRDQTRWWRTCGERTSAARRTHSRPALLRQDAPDATPSSGTRRAPMLFELGTPPPRPRHGREAEGARHRRRAHANSAAQTRSGKLSDTPAASRMCCRSGKMSRTSRRISHCAEVVGKATHNRPDRKKQAKAEVPKIIPFDSEATKGTSLRSLPPCL